MTTLMNDKALITNAEIADNYGYKTSSLAVMRHRHADFPKPITGVSAVRYYSRSEIEEWFSKRREETRPYRKHSPILTEIVKQLSNDLVLQSRVLIFLEEQKTK